MAPGITPCSEIRGTPTKLSVTDHAVTYQSLIEEIADPWQIQPDTQQKSLVCLLFDGRMRRPPMHDDIVVAELDVTWVKRELETVFES